MNCDNCEYRDVCKKTLDLQYPFQCHDIYGNKEAEEGET